MKVFGVNKTAIAQFEQEYTQWHLSKAAGRTVSGSALISGGSTGPDLTQSWLFRRNPSRASILPLCEVVWFYKRVVNTSSHSVVICFSNGFSDEIHCNVRAGMMKDEDTSSLWISSLERLCPKAMQGYSFTRETAWTKDSKTFASNIKAGKYDFAD
jgi:hypothetical protein